LTVGKGADLSISAM